jgi:aspartate aminotransferase
LKCIWALISKNTPMKHLSIAAKNVGGQPMFKLLDKVQMMERAGQEILHFELGEPNFNTPENITEAACEALRQGETHYVSSMGIYSLREVVQQTTEKSRGFKPDIDQILVTPGANAIIYLAISCLVNPGEEVIVPDPGFPTYFSAIKYCGALPVSVPLYESNNFRMNPEDLRKRITSKTRLIILNSPSNPTGALMTQAEIDEIASIAEEHDVYLLSDEIYARMIFDDFNHFHTPAKLDKCKERTIIINGFSKAFAMTGWRLGVAIGPKEVIEKMGLMIQTIVSCVPPFIQLAGIEAIKGDQTPILKMMAEYKNRRDILIEGLNNIPGIRCTKPEGAIYAFPNISNTGMSSEEFADFILEKAGVALLPGTNFGKHGQGFVRLCYVNSQENIELAIEKIAMAIKDR